MFTAHSLSKEASDLLFEITESKQVVRLRPQLKFAVRDGDAAILLNQLMYWASQYKAQKNDGWFYVTREELFFQTGLTIYEQIKARDFLKNLGLIEEQRRGSAGRMHFRVNLEAVTKLYAKARLQLVPDVGHVQQHDVGHVQQHDVGHVQQHSKEQKTLLKTKQKIKQNIHTQEVSEIQAKTVCVSKSRFSFAECLEYTEAENRMPENFMGVWKPRFDSPIAVATAMVTNGLHDQLVAAYQEQKANKLLARIEHEIHTAVWWLTNGYGGKKVTTWSQLRDVLDVELWPLLEEPIRATLSAEHPQLLARLDGQQEIPSEAVA